MADRLQTFETLHPLSCAAEYSFPVIFCIPAVLIFGEDSDVTSQCLIATEGVADGTYSIPTACQSDLITIAQTTDPNTVSIPIFLEEFPKIHQMLAL